MDTYTPPRLSIRQMRLGAWIRDPRNSQLCRDPGHGHDWHNAFWTAQQLVDLAGIYEQSPEGRRACLHDLQVLRQRGDVWRWGNDRSTRWSRAFG